METLASIAFYKVFGMTLFVYWALLGFVFLLLTAYTGHKYSKKHKLFARITLAIIFIHAILAFLLYF